ncbi:MAG: hypothetical protein AB7U82_33665 [Blastocatellales bacterium]
MPRAKTKAKARPHRYDQKTINRCFQLYLLYNGKQHERIAAEMRREYPWFNATRIPEWEKKYAWESALRVKIETDKRAALTTADELVDEIETVRKKLYELIKGDGSHDKELTAQHIHYCRLSVEALTKVKEARDTFGAWLAFWERLLDWLPQFSTHALDSLLQISDAVIDRAAKEYGSSDEGDDEDDEEGRR